MKTVDSDYVHLELRPREWLGWWPLASDNLGSRVSRRYAREEHLEGLEEQEKSSFSKFLQESIATMLETHQLHSPAVDAPLRLPDHRHRLLRLLLLDQLSSRVSLNHPLSPPSLIPSSVTRPSPETSSFIGCLVFAGKPACLPALK